MTVLLAPTFLSAKLAEPVTGLTASAPMTPNKVPVLVSVAARVLSYTLLAALRPDRLSGLGEMVPTAPEMTVGSV